LCKVYANPCRHDLSHSLYTLWYPITESILLCLQRKRPQSQILSRKGPRKIKSWYLLTMRKFRAWYVFMYSWLFAQWSQGLCTILMLVRAFNVHLPFFFIKIKMVLASCSVQVLFSCNAGNSVLCLQKLWSSLLCWLSRYRSKRGLLL